MKFREPRNFFELTIASMLFLIPIAGLLFVCLRFKGTSLDEMEGLSLPGFILATAAAVPHELLHAIAFPKGSDISFWYYPQALVFFVYSTTPVSERDAEKRALDSECRRLVLDVETENLPALNLYKKLGFREARRSSARIRGTEFSFLSMIKTFGDRPKETKADAE